MAYRFLLPLSCLVLITACPAKEENVPEDSSSGSTSESASASDTGASGSGTTSDIEATMGPDLTSNGTTDSGDTDTGVDSDEAPQECLLPSHEYDAYITTPEEVWVDEPCVVTASQQAGDALELGFLCPMAGAVALTVTGGPLPHVELGETLDVFYQPEHIPPLDFPHMGLLFLRSGNQLRYGAVTGFLFKQGQGEGAADLDAITAGLAPLTLGVEMGACPLVQTGQSQGGDDWVCEFEALAAIRLAFGDESLLHAEGTVGLLAAGADSYVLDVRFARRGTQCIDYSLDRIAVAVALQSP